MTLADLELALTELVDLLYSDDQSESIYQRWLEANPIVFQMLGYTRIISHPELRLSSGRKMIPDFMAQSSSGLWEIVEIKRPDTSVLKQRTRRQHFYLEFEKYVRQCREYSVFFEDDAHRLQFEKMYQTSIQRRVKARLLAGSSEGLDRRRAHDLAAEVPLLDFETYDDLFERLENARRRLAWGSEDVPGFSAFLAISAPFVEGFSQWLLDIGANEGRSRLSVLIIDRTLAVHILDDTGTSYRMHIPAPINQGLDCLVGFEIGFTDAATVGRVWINDHVETARWPRFPLNLPDNYPMTLGNNMACSAKASNFRLYKLAAHPHVFDFRRRLALRHTLSQNRTAYLLFTGGCAMSTSDHPKLF